MFNNSWFKLEKDYDYGYEFIKIRSEISVLREYIVKVLSNYDYAETNKMVHDLVSQFNELGRRISDVGAILDNFIVNEYQPLLARVERIEDRLCIKNFESGMIEMGELDG
jgi:hypothetical protein